MNKDKKRELKLRGRDRQKKSTHRLRPAKNMENMKNHVPGAPHNARARARGAESFLAQDKKQL